MIDEAPMTPEQLASILVREFENADSYHDQLEGLRDQAFRYYEAQPFGNEIEGRSQIILPDVQETIDYMTASLLRTFISGDKTVEFEAASEADEDVVVEASEAINYIFMRKQDGYRILHDVTVDGLLRKTGIFKTVKETEEKVVRQTFNMDPLLIGSISGEVEDVTENEDGTVTVTVKETRITAVFRDYAIPPSEFRFTPDARGEDDADYLCHVAEKTRSDLIEMGFDREQVESLPIQGNDFRNLDSSESALDYNLRDDNSFALQRVLLCEEYARIDVDGDGIAERVKVFRVDHEILKDAETGEVSIELVEEHPFAVFCPFPRPHRLVGYSLADKVLDIQLSRSFVGRQLFDGLAFSNMPRYLIDENLASKNTYKDVLTPIPGSPIRVKGGAGAVQPVATSFDVGRSLTVLEWITSERESRTGITRLNQGLDADALNKTATGTALLQSQGQQQEEFVARNLAEAVSRLFAKKYRLMRTEAEPFQIKVDGQHKTVDPSKWPEEMQVIVRVGLGSGSKQKRIQARFALLEPLTAALQQGLAGPEHAFNWMDAVARDADIGKGADYMFDPSDSEQSNQDRPGPAAQQARAELEMEQAKLQSEQQMSLARLQIQADEAAQKQRLAREQAEFDAALARDKAQFEAELARDKAEFEAQLATEKLAMERERAQTISANRPGGSLAE